MTEKKYAFLELGGKNCPCRIPAVYHSAIVGYTCGKDKQDCNEQRCKNCPHGKTKDELECIIAPIIKENQHMMGYEDEIVEALLGGGGK